MPIDYTHAHLSSSVMRDGNPQTPISPDDGGVAAEADDPIDQPSGTLPIWVNTSNNNLWVWDGTVWRGPYAALT